MAAQIQDYDFLKHTCGDCAWCLGESDNMHCRRNVWGYAQGGTCHARLGNVSPQNKACPGFVAKTPTGEAVQTNPPRPQTQ